MQAKPHLCVQTFVLQLIRYEEKDTQMSKANKGGCGAGRGAWRGCVCLTRPLPQPVRSSSVPVTWRITEGHSAKGAPRGVNPGLSLALGCAGSDHRRGGRLSIICVCKAPSRDWPRRRCYSAPPEEGVGGGGPYSSG